MIEKFKICLRKTPHIYMGLIIYPFTMVEEKFGTRLSETPQIDTNITFSSFTMVEENFWY